MIKENAPVGAQYKALVYETVEYLRCENNQWYWWNGFSWLHCATRTVKTLNLIPL